ncbi:MAG TPA: ABC transporter permease [Blastocatellia bacterium]|nr:ABC transporter permease [Blastocatellia bacterium]
MRFPWSRRRDEELDEEIRAHLEMAVRERMERGETAEQARRAVLREFGNVGLVKEVTREMWGWGWLEQLGQDLRFGARMLIKRPGFAFVAVLTLALGIGANTAIFSVVNAVLLRPLPYAEPERLVFIYDAWPGGRISKSPLMEAEFLRLRDEAGSLEQVSLYTTATLTLTGAGEPERVACGTASGDLFAALGVPMALGRTFMREEEPRGRGHVVILSHGFWERKFAGAQGAIGQALTLDGRSYTIIGVLPQGFKSPPELQADTAIELWLPPGYNLAGPCCSHGLNVVARLRGGQTLAQAQAEADTIMAGVQRDYPDGFPKDGVKRATIRPLEQEIVGDLRRPLWVLLAAVLFVLLIACANVANLLLARSETRQKEIALRTALGAGRSRIIRQLLAESLLLAIIGGGMGLLLASLGLRLLPVIGSEKIPRLQEVALDVRVLGFTLLVSLLTSVVFGLVPAYQAVKFDLQTALKEGGRAAASARGRSRLRAALVIAEVALSLVLLVGAGLLIKSFWRLRQIDTGFRAEQVLTLRLFPPASAYPDDQHVAAFYEELLRRVRSLPGVTDAAVVDAVPLGDRSGGTVLEVEGRPVELSALNSAGWRVVSPDYFRTLGVRLLRGRFLEDADQGQAKPVAVINETLARAHWPDKEPLGQRIRLLNRPPGFATTAFLTVVGVVADVKNEGLTQAAGQEVYVPLRQREAAIDGMGLERQMSLAVRTSGEPLELAKVIRQEVGAVDPSVPVASVRTMEQILATVTVQPRFNMILLGIFAAVALVMASVGIYGVLSYSVTQRTQEIGIRLALGARQGDVLKMVVSQGMLLALTGMVIGVASSFALTRLMAGLLYGVSATDPLTFAAIAFLLGGVALLACYLPARRAAKVDPMTALRYE